MSGSYRPLVLVSLVFYPDSSASGQLFTDLLTRAAGDGQEAIALTAFPAKSGHDIGLPRHEHYQGVEIFRRGLRIDAKTNLATRPLSYLAFYVHAAWTLLRLAPGRDVLVGSDPPGLPVLVWFLSHLRRFDYICLMLDVYPEGLIALGSLGERSPLVRVWRWLNGLSYRRARALAVLGRDMVPVLERSYGSGIRTVYIPHWAPKEVEAPPVGRNEALDPIGLRHKFVVQYSGNMGLWHDMDSIVRAAALLRDREDIHLLMIGSGRRRAAAERLAGQLSLSNITWQDFVPRDRLRESLAACDAALISLREGLEGVAVPSKLYGILASGRAVIAQVPVRSEVGLVVEETGCGVVVQTGSAEALAAAIRRLADDRALTAEMGERARRTYQSTYTVETALGAFRRLSG